jgi:hypothetical protein
LGVEVGTKFAVFNTTLVLLWYLGVARMLEIFETVEGVLMKDRTIFKPLNERLIRGNSTIK